MTRKTTKADLRARLLSGKSALRSELVRINAMLDGEGNPLELEVRGLMAGRAFAIKRESEDDDGAIDNEKFYPALLIETVYDPSTGDPVFSKGDRDAILDMPSEVIEQLAMIATELSGIGANGYRAVEKNSDAAARAATAATPTDSLNAST